MIWLVTSITLYLIISFAALLVIASEEKERGKDAYFDIRNIGAALIWCVFLILFGIASLFNISTKTKDNGTGDK